MNRFAGRPVGTQMQDLDFLKILFTNRSTCRWWTKDHRALTISIIIQENSCFNAFFVKKKFKIKWLTYQQIYQMEYVLNIPTKKKEKQNKSKARAISDKYWILLKILKNIEESGKSLPSVVRGKC